jgi:hypothetical protein
LDYPTGEKSILQLYALRSLVSFAHHKQPKESFPTSDCTAFIVQGSLGLYLLNLGAETIEIKQILET